MEIDFVTSRTCCLTCLYLFMISTSVSNTFSFTWLLTLHVIASNSHVMGGKNNKRPDGLYSSAKTLQKFATK